MSSKSTKKNLIPPATVCLFLVIVLAFPIWSIWPGDAWSWLRDGKNNSLIVAIAAVAQAIGAIILIGLTRISNRTATRVANEARAQGREEGDRARQQMIWSIEPRLTFDKIYVSSVYVTVDLRVTNIGRGPAIETRLELQQPSDQQLEYDSRPGKKTIFTLQPGESLPLTYTLRDMRALEKGIGHRITIAATYIDLFYRHHRAEVELWVNIGLSSDNRSVELIEIRHGAIDHDPLDNGALITP